MVPYQSSYAGFPEHYVLPQTTSCLYGSSSAPPLVYRADNSASSSYQPWYFDSGATNHITNNLQNLNLGQTQQTALQEGVLVGNGHTLPVTHTGQGLLPTPHGNF